MERGVILVSFCIFIFLILTITYGQEEPRLIDLPEPQDGISHLTSESGLAKQLPKSLDIKDASGTELKAQDIKSDLSSLQAQEGIFKNIQLISDKDNNQITLTSQDKTITFNVDKNSRIDITKDKGKYSIKLSQGVELILNQFTRFLALQDNAFFNYFSDIEFSFSKGSFSYDNEFKETVKTDSTSRVSLSYEYGVICMILSKDAYYRYQEQASIKILNSKLNSYEVCTRKSKEQTKEDKDAFLDLIDKEFKLKSIFNYYINDDLVIGSLNTNNVFTLKNKEDFSIKLLKLKHNSQGDIANIYNKYKYLIEYGKYYLSRLGKYQEYIDRFESKPISIENNLISNEKNKVDIK